MTASPPAAPGAPSEETIREMVEAAQSGLLTDSEAARVILDLIRPAFEAKDAETRELHNALMDYRHDLTEAELDRDYFKANLAQAVEALTKAKDEIVRTADDLSMHSPSVKLVEEIATIIGQPALNSRAIVREAASAAARGR